MAICGRRKEKLDEAMQEFEKLGLVQGKDWVFAATCDIRKYEEVVRLLEVSCVRGGYVLCFVMMID